MSIQYTYLGIFSIFGYRVSRTIFSGNGIVFGSESIDSIFTARNIAACFPGFFIFYTMSYTILPKKTFYNGIWYRSRLEAQWQAYFDMIGFDAEYEPHYVNTIDWLPDFELTGKDQYLVEVKPLSNWDDDLINKLLINAENHNVLLLHENIYYDDLTESVFIGKVVVTNKAFKLFDFAISTNIQPKDLFNLWKEAKNKTSYIYGRLD